MDFNLRGNVLPKKTNEFERAEQPIDLFFVPRLGFSNRW